jgi:exosortase
VAAVKEMTSRNLLHGLDVRAVVLVGGRDFGRCPLASHRPTALWPITDKPVLAYLLDHLANAGFERVAVCCAKDDAAAVGAVCHGARLNVIRVVEELTTGTAGCLRDAVASDPGDLIVVLSASMLAPPAVEDLVKAHQAGAAELTLVFNPGAGHSAMGGAAEIYLCRPEVLHHIPHGGYSDIKEGLIPSVLRAGGVIRPLVLEQAVGNFHNRAGYLEALEVLFRKGASGGLRAPLWAPARESLGRQTSDGSVHPTARTCGPVLMGARARLAEGALVIGPAVIGPDVVVGAGSVVVRSALWAGAHVGARCAIRESIVDCRAMVPDETEIVETTVSPSLSGPGQNHRLFRSGGRDVGRTAEQTSGGKGACFERLAAGPLGRALHSWNRLAYALGGAIVLAALLWSYWPTVIDLIREWNFSDEYSSGLLVPFLAAYIVWLRRRDLQSTPIQPALFLGVLAFLLAQAVRAVGLDFYSFAERFSLVLSLAAVVLMVLGRKYLAKLATILLFLCLMLPWPHRVQGLITLPLQRWSSNSAVFCLELAGYEIQQEGNVIHIGDTSVAVAEACNGLRMITAFFVISGLVVLLVKRAWWEKLIVLASSLPIAFLCNTLRLAATAVFFTIIKGQQWEQRFHDWGGYAMMPLALALIVGELALLARLTTPPTEIEPAIISRRHPSQVPDPQ